jgi:general secretion pathway protein C
LPLIVTVLAVVLLSASLAYWGLQLFKPQQRAIAAPPPAPPMGINLDAAKGLFGGQVMVAAVSNYQLKGVVAARGDDSAAIISVDSKPALAIALGKEVVPGVMVKEVHARHVILSEGGVNKRVDLPSDAGVSSGPASLPGQPGVQQAPPAMPQPVMQQTPAQTPGQPPVAPMGIAPIPSNNQNNQ